MDIFYRDVYVEYLVGSVYSNVTIYRQAYYMVLDTGYLLSSVSVYK